MGRFSEIFKWRDDEVNLPLGRGTKIVKEFSNTLVFGSTNDDVRRRSEQHVAIFPPCTNLRVRVQCFILALKKGSNNFASGSIFCSPSIFYWGHRQFLSTCSCSSTMYMCILYYTMYILSTSYILLRYVLQQLETGNPTIKKINQLSHGNINEDTRSSSTQYILPS